MARLKSGRDITLRKILRKSNANQQECQEFCLGITVTVFTRRAFLIYLIVAMAEIKENSVGIVETKTIRIVEPAEPLELECGKTLAPIDVAYETYGRLNDAQDNTVLICHALSGNAHVAGRNSPDDKKPGWWDVMVGPAW